MGILCTFIGILFFMNPFFRMLDFMPDFIGCILIIIGTTKLSYIDHRIDNARRLTKYYAGVSALKIPLSLYFAVYEKGYLLPGTFIFSVLEAMLIIGIFTSLFGGLEYITARENLEKRHLKNAENASVICFIFAIARAVMSFVPELFSLGTQKDSFDYDFFPTPEKDLAFLKVYAEVLFFVMMLIFGIYTAIICGNYFIKLTKDKELKSVLSERYNVYIIENIQEVDRKRVTFALSVFFVAIVLLFNQILDYVNIIPNTLSYIFLFAGMLYLIARFRCNRLKKLLPIFIPLTALSVYNNVIQYRLLSTTEIDFFYEKMYVRDVPALLQTTDHLPRLIAPIVTEYLVLAVICAFVIKALTELPFIGDKDTVSIFQILLSLTGIVYFVSSAYVYFGQFIRTAFTYQTAKLEVYVKYDSILALCEWVCLGSFFMLLCFAYKFGADIVQRVHSDDKI